MSAGRNKDRDYHEKEKKEFVLNTTKFIAKRCIERFEENCKKLNDDKLIPVISKGLVDQDGYNMDVIND